MLVIFFYLRLNNLCNIKFQTMPISFPTSFQTTFRAESLMPAFLKKFLSWSERQKENRFLWLGVSLGVHGCFLTPITAMVVLTTTASMFLFSLTIAAMGIAVIANLAGLSTRITIPVFVFSILMDFGVLIACAVLALR